MGKPLRIGVIGHTANNFDYPHTWKKIRQALLAAVEAESISPTQQVIVVGNLLNTGVQGIAYTIARQRGWNIGAVFPKMATISPVTWFRPNVDGDFAIARGRSWGDEFGMFLRNVDIIVRIGGGRITDDQVNQAIAKGKPVYQYRLAIDTKD